MHNGVFPILGLIDMLVATWVNINHEQGLRRIDDFNRIGSPSVRVNSGTSDRSAALPGNSPAAAARFTAQHRIECGHRGARIR